MQGCRSVFLFNILIFASSILEAGQKVPCAQIVSSLEMGIEVRAKISEAWNHIGEVKAQDRLAAIKAFALEVAKLPIHSKILFKDIDEKEDGRLNLRNIHNITTAIQREGVHDLEIASDDPAVVERAIVDSISTWLESGKVGRRRGIKINLVEIDPSTIIRVNKPKPRLAHQVDRDAYLASFENEQMLTEYLRKTQIQLWDSQNLVRLLASAHRILRNKNTSYLRTETYHELEGRLTELLNNGIFDELNISQLSEVLLQIRYLGMRGQPEFMHKLAQIIIRKMQEGDNLKQAPFDLVSNYISFLSIHDDAPEFLWAEIEARIKSGKLDTVDPEKLANYVSSVARASVLKGQYRSKEFYESIFKLFFQLKPEEVTRAVWHRLRTVQVALRLERNWELALPEAAPKIEDFVHDSDPTAVEKRLAEAATYLNAGLKADYNIGGLLTVDVADPKRKIAVEVDGASHYDASGNRFARDDFQDRLLGKMGWQVVHVKMGDIQNLRNGTLAAWLRQTLDTAERRIPSTQSMN